MTSTNKTLASALLNFTQDFIKQHHEQRGHLPLIEGDEQWPSACEQGAYDKTYNYWKPINIFAEQDNTAIEELSFVNVESALNLNLHDDIKTYFTTVYSHDIEACCEQGNLSLLFAWNREDFARLQENIIGHILMKQRLKQAETVFFAVTDEEDIIISIDNNNGEVWVERVGCIPHKKLSDSLLNFIEQLTVKI